MEEVEPRSESVFVDQGVFQLELALPPAPVRWLFTFFSSFSSGAERHNGQEPAAAKGVQGALRLPKAEKDQIRYSFRKQTLIDREGHERGIYFLLLV